jgi:cardiolipin synthase
MPEGLRAPAFGQLLRRINDGGELHDGQHVAVFQDGDQATKAMLAAVAASASEVLLEAYIFRDDEIGQHYLRELRRAAERGVAVRVLADGWGSLTTRVSFWKAMRQAGIDVRLYRPLFSSLRWQPFRDHRKLMVVDRHIAFTGGMNIGDQYASFSRRKIRYTAMRDTHVRIEGSVAWEMAAVFGESWERAGGPPLPRASRPTNDATGAQVLVLASGPRRGYRETASILASVAAAARESLWMSSAYFVPGRSAVALIGDAAERGLDVRLLVPGHTDVPIARHAGHRWFSALLQRGVRIFEYQPAILHAKSLVADRYASVVGSTNMDMRSFRFNAECNVVVLDSVVGEAMAATFEDDLRSANEIRLDAWRRRGLFHQLGDKAAAWLRPIL